MDPSVCRLHPGVAVTGFCPACLRDRLAGLQPPSSADLRRCKSFSYARSAASQLEPQRRSCDLFRQEQPSSIMVMAVPEQEEEERRMEAAEPSRKSSFGGLLGKKLQQWRRKKKDPHPPIPPEEEEMPGRHRQHSLFRGDLDGRRSCDLSGPVFDHLVVAPAAMLSVEEDSMPQVPRSDGQIPVEEDYYYDYMPGGCAQTRDYYLDSSSSGIRRRRSVDRSTTSGRNSFSDINNSELPSRMATNARVSPAMAADQFYHAHHQSVLVHHRSSRDYWDQLGPTNYSNNNLRRDDDFSGSFGSALFRVNKEADNNMPKKGIKGWSIWGLIHKKKSSSSRKPEADHRSLFSSSAAAPIPPPGVIGEQGEYPWPELRARGYNGRMLRCNSSISARSSFNGAAAMVGRSARRSVSGIDMQHDVNGGYGSGRMRMDEVLLERTMSTRSSYSRSGHDHPTGAANYQFNHNGVRSSKTKKPSAMPRTRRSTLGPYSTDPIPRH